MSDVRALLPKTRELGRRAAVESRAFTYAWRAGLFRLDRPRKGHVIFRAMDRLGQIGAAIDIAAIRHGDRPGLIDELGSLTFAELEDRSIALACALRARGVREGDTVGILCRNHRGFIDITFAAGQGSAPGSCT